MDAISVEELVRHPDKLIEDAQNGKLSVVTKDGRPIFMAVPYDDQSGVDDVYAAMAVRLYQNEVISLGRAAKMAGVSIGEFIDRLGAMKIPVIRYSAEDLERELAQFG